jgi:hypothetical protein
MKKITYTKGRWKYRLTEPEVHETGIQTDGYVFAFCSITPSGTLTFDKGFSWDGPSGPTVDTKNFMRGSAIHDALYLLLREAKLPKKVHRKIRKRADEILWEACLEDKMPRFRAWYVYWAVRAAAWRSSRGSRRKVYTAP